MDIRKIKFPAISIFTKLNLLILTVILILGFVLGFFFVRHQTKSLTLELEDRINDVIKNLSQRVEFPILVGDRDGISKITASALSYKDVIYCRIENDKGVLLAQTDPVREESVREFSIPITSQEKHPGTAEDLLLGMNQGPREEIGKIFLKITLSDFDSKIRAVKKAIILRIVVMIFCASLVSFFLFDIVLIRPVRNLIKGTQNLSKGDLNYRVPIRNLDEIGQLSSSFNQMAEDLKQTLVSRDELEELFSLTNATLESTGDGIIAINQEGDVSTHNTSIFKYCTLKGSLLSSSSLNQVADSIKQNLKNPQIMDDCLRKLKERPEIATHDILEFKDGRIVELGTNPQKVENRIVGNVFSFHDITERVKAEEQKHQLQNLVYQSEKMAAIGQLAGGVAHEINNPLGVILGFSQGLLRRTPLDSPIKMPLDSIEREAIRCKNLVQDLLNYSRMGKMDKEICSINQVIETTLSLVQSQARVSFVELKKELSENLPDISINRNQIQQVIVNLCNNAMDAMDKGGALTIQTRQIDAMGEHLIEIQVRDTGTGIPKENLSRIFEPFYTTKEVGKGTGLGLSLVYEIIQRHNGSINVESELRKGTTFKIQLPIKIEKA